MGLVVKVGVWSSPLVKPFEGDALLVLRPRRNIIRREIDQRRATFMRGVKQQTITLRRWLAAAAAMIRAGCVRSTEQNATERLGQRLIEIGPSSCHVLSREHRFARGKCCRASRTCRQRACQCSPSGRGWRVREEGCTTLQHFVCTAAPAGVRMSRART